jgi:hypothetical protein
MLEESEDNNYISRFFKYIDISHHVKVRENRINPFIMLRGENVNYFDTVYKLW